MPNTLVKIKMGPTFAKQCNEMFKKYGDDVFYEWRTATGKVFQDIAYRKSFDREYQWIKMTPNTVQKAFMRNPAQIYKFVLVGNNLRAYSMGTLKHIKMVFFLSRNDLMKKSVRKEYRKTKKQAKKELYDFLMDWYTPWLHIDPDGYEIMMEEAEADGLTEKEIETIERKAKRDLDKRDHDIAMSRPDEYYM